MKKRLIYILLKYVTEFIDDPEKLVTYIIEIIYIYPLQ